MKSKPGAIAAILVLLVLLGGLTFVLLGGGLPAEEAPEENPLPSVPVSKGSIVDEISGAAEIKGSVTEKLKAADWKYFNAFVAPFNTRIPAGTPLVEYANGGALLAPYDLVVLSKSLPEKKWDALTAEHYVEVTRVDTMHVELSVHETDIAALAIGQPAQITLGSDESLVFSGVITNINQVGSYDASGSKYTVTIEVVNEGAMLIGMSSDVRIVVGEVSDVLMVPVSAITDTPEGSFVTKVNADGTLEQVPVETGLSDGEAVEIKSGLAEGDNVVIYETSSEPMNASGAGVIYSFSSPA